MNIYYVDARLLVSRYRAELWIGDTYDRRKLVWQSPDSYPTVEDAWEAARRQIAVERAKIRVAA